jgi:hypothetical protein
MEKRIYPPIRLGIVSPRARTRAIALAALRIAFGVECSQLYEAEWINRIRATRVGGLILGRGWVTTDLVCYAAGVGIGTLGEILKIRRVIGGEQG